MRLTALQKKISEHPMYTMLDSEEEEEDRKESYNMKLTSELQRKITANPTYTILRSQNSELDEKHNRIAVKYIPYDMNIPENFSGKKIWKGLLSPVKDQSLCGACWAFASTSVLADRFNIQSGGKYKVNFSPTKLILCGKDFENKDAKDILINQLKYNEKSYTQKVINDNIRNLKESACNGNSLYNALEYLYVFGTCLNECIPYEQKFGTENEFQKIGDFSSSAQLPLCSYVSGPQSDMCSDFFIASRTGVEGGTPQRFYRAFDIYSVPGTKNNNGNEKIIRQEIYRWGPVVSAMKIYTNFYTFDPTKEIYQWDGYGEQIGGHAVEITGWGIENNVPFWEIKNSWGNSWGQDGYFKMIRGINNCEIEENIFGLIPDFFYPTNTELKKELHLKNDTFASKLRYKLDNNIGTIDGGIDPSTGYSRRVMETFFIDFSRPVPLKDLPINLHEFKLSKDLHNIKPESKKIFIAADIRDPNIFKNNLIIFIVFVIIIIIIATIIIIIQK